MSLPVEKDKSSIAGQSRVRKAIKLISLLSLLISSFHLIQLIQVVINWPVLRSLPLSRPPLYLAVEGLIWFCSGLWIGWGLWKRRTWSKLALIIGSLAYSLFFWVKQIWLFNQDASTILSPIKILLTAAGLGLIMIVLTHPASRSYFEENPVRIP